MAVFVEVSHELDDDAQKSHELVMKSIFILLFGHKMPKRLTCFFLRGCPRPRAAIHKQQLMKTV